MKLSGSLNELQQNANYKDLSKISKSLTIVLETSPELTDVKVIGIIPNIVNTSCTNLYYKNILHSKPILLDNIQLLSKSDNIQYIYRGNYLLTASGPLTPTPSPAPASAKQKWRWCVWSTKGWQATIENKSCGKRGNPAQPTDGSDPTDGSILGSAGFGAASGCCACTSGSMKCSESSFKVLKKSGVPSALHNKLLPRDLLQTWPCSGGTNEVLFPEGKWAWILHGSIAANACTDESAKVTKAGKMRYCWWIKNVFGSKVDNMDPKGSFTISGKYLQTLKNRIDTSDFPDIDITNDFTAYASAGHGMWGGTCINFDLSLFWLETEKKIIINMQTGPRTWSGENIPYGGKGGYSTNIVPHGITLTGKDEYGKPVDSDLDIFTTDDNGTLRLKDGITANQAPTQKNPSIPWNCKGV